MKNCYVCKSLQIITMPGHVVVLIVTYFMLCLSFNYTFPLHRYVDNTAHFNSLNSSYAKNQQSNLLDRTKGVASSVEMALRKLKDSTQDFGRNMYDKVKRKYILNEDDLRNYEQLVILKKHPYLDWNDLQLKFNPSSRHNVRFSENYVSDSSEWEPAENNIKVEVFNRGLSGFEIPSLIKSTGHATNTKALGSAKENDDEIKGLRSELERYLLSLNTVE